MNGLKVLLPWIILAFLIFLLYKEKFSWFGLLYLILLAIQPLVLGLIILPALPPNNIHMGPDLPLLPIGVAAIMILLGGACLLIRRLPSGTGNISPLRRWVWLIVGILTLCLAFIFWALTIWAPQWLQSSHSLPWIGSPFWLIAIAVISLVLYFISRQNTLGYPNLMRYVVIGLPFLMVSCNSTFAMILLHAYPSPPQNLGHFLGRHDEFREFTPGPLGGRVDERLHLCAV